MWLKWGEGGVESDYLEALLSHGYEPQSNEKLASPKSVLFALIRDFPNLKV